jgi:Tol biopolymer transport system component
VVLKSPEQVGQVGLGVSPDGRKLQFYRNSHVRRHVFKVAPIRGGAFAEVAFSRLVSGGNLSSPDGQRWVFVGYKGDKYAPYVAASAAGDPVEVKLPVQEKPNVAYNNDPSRWRVSPDGKRLFRRDPYIGTRGEVLYDCYVFPISLEKAQSTGPATLILKEWRGVNHDVAWSPDSSRLVISAFLPGNADLWVVPADGSPPRQLTQSPEVEESPKWSPDGRFIAYGIESAGQVSLYIIPAEGGAPKRLWTKPAVDELPRYVWFPDSREIGLVSDDALVAIAIADGSARPFLKVAEAGLRWLYGLKWSPDGQTLALWGENDDGYQTALFYASDKKIEMLPPDPDWKTRLGWTGDSQAIFYGASRDEKVRPAALIYEVDLGEAWTQAKNSVAGESSPAGASPIAKLEAPPLVNGEFRDDFEDGDTKYWTLQDEAGGLDRVREVRNGELVLENARAIIGAPEWTNYVVTVRMRIKEADGVVPRSGQVAGVGFRRGEHGDYMLGADQVEKDVWQLWLGVGYSDAEKRFRAGTLAEPRYNFVLDKWYTLQVEVKGPHIVVRVDGQPTIDLNDENCPQGPVTLFSGVGSRVHFDDFSVRLLQ